MKGDAMYEMSREFVSTHVAGFEHWDGAEVAHKLKPGKKLRLKPESDNPYDPNAVMVFCGKTKIGYVPRAKNEALAQLLHFGHGKVFEARVQSVNWACHPEHQVRMTIRVRDARS